MTGRLEDVRTKIPPSCCVNRCQAQGCSVSMKDAPTPFVLVDMDCQDLSVNRNAVRCDFIFFSDSGSWVAPIELKRGKLRTGELVSQLQAGARFAEQVVPKGVTVRVVPIGVYGGRAHRREVNRLSQSSSQIRFRGKPTKIELLKCGRPLIEALRGRE